ncbi:MULTISPECIES: hypothetical protein [unclassified Diaminobutyricimonas]|uniref:hypothetical protein n=1 Tax=unclassified Diaminobutyricimonas TaxID=2643261 RepID=UPI0012F49174|nr:MULTISPECIES: hypothetical protein [unclassified Diaminobutyricimonas]
MRWVEDIARGEWLCALLDTRWQDMHAVVPHGYEAYTRIFHPVPRDRPRDTGTWHAYGLIDTPELESESVRWAVVAEAFGQTMHPLAQYHRLLGRARVHHVEAIDAAGWRYAEPEEGCLEIPLLAQLARHLVQHTATPESGIAAVWEGWGGLTGGVGYAVASIGPLGRDGLISPAPSSAQLPVEAVNGPRLRLPDRDYFLFEVGIGQFTDAAWASSAPWVSASDRPQSPSVLWPDDHAWVLVTEIDYDSTVVAGPRELIDRIVGDLELEALEIPEGADLSWRGDRIN